MARVLAWAAEELPHIEHSAHAAGVSGFALLQDMSLPDFQVVVDVKVSGRRRLLNMCEPPVQSKQAAYKHTPFPTKLPLSFLPAGRHSSSLPAGRTAPLLPAALLIHLCCVEPERISTLCGCQCFPGCSCCCQPGGRPALNSGAVWAVCRGRHGSLSCGWLGCPGAQKPPAGAGERLCNGRRRQDEAMAHPSVFKHPSRLYQTVAHRAGCSSPPGSRRRQPAGVCPPGCAALCADLLCQGPLGPAGPAAAHRSATRGQCKPTCCLCCCCCRTISQACC